MIRLFANMLAGHVGDRQPAPPHPADGGINIAFGVGMVPISLVLALFIMMLEILVAFIQAYIFTVLTSIFIGMNAHPAH
jgi:F-type H+-transporting ATPase subunit a